MIPARRLVFAALACLGGVAVAVAPAGAGDSDAENHKPRPVDIQILAINDFHGNLESGGSLTLDDGTSIPAGGAAYLATHLRAAEATNRNTAIVSAGDLIGASPLISALFHDEPTIEAANLWGLDFNAVGNHEFDEGATELLRMQKGGCHPVDGCQDGDPFDGAEFKFLAANVLDTAKDRTLFAPYKIKTYQGVKVAFVGMTLEGTPTIVTPSGVAGLSFSDEADTVNALIPELERKADVIVVLLHEGGTPSGGRLNDCQGVSGPIVDIVNRTSRSVDLFITGHTHQNYSCVIDGRPVTSSRSFGRLYTDIDLTYDKASKTLVSTKVDNKPVTRTVTPAADLVALVDKYKTLSAPFANRVIGTITADLLRAANPAGESVLGNVIADAQLAATAPAGFGAAKVAFMNPGGVRADLLAATSTGGEPVGSVTYGEAFTVQPFGNSLVTMTLTGAQIDTLLEQQWAGQTSPRILHPSVGFSYTWSAAAAAGSKVDAATIKIGGVAVDPAASYRVTVNSFLADGGDNFVVLRNGTDRLGGAQDLDAFEAWLVANPNLAPPPLNRITTIA